jgi:hypothetical protein
LSSRRQKKYHAWSSDFIIDLSTQTQVQATLTKHSDINIQDIQMSIFITR